MHKQLHKKQYMQGKRNNAALDFNFVPSSLQSPVGSCIIANNMNMSVHHHHHHSISGHSGWKMLGTQGLRPNLKPHDHHCSPNNQ
uniref:Uncharacterized protein n=1 Tax=Nelumbo nucifera TaxID=4432 RepID=A0A822ZGZ3_NELNU|nr:TPA_asm: hypothetical protein HUJ06_015261 [Nelumbo nucifera]